MWLRRATALWLVVAAVAFASPACAGRYAFIVAVDDYAHLPRLRSAVADARHVAAALEAAGFTTTLVLDATAGQIAEEMARFRSRLTDASLVVAYFAGHGVSLGSGSHFLPADATVAAGRLKGALPLGLMIEAISSPRAQTVVFFDACRLPLGARPDAGERAPRRTAGIYILHATAPLHAATDAARAPGPFAAALAAALSEENVTVEEVGRRVRLAVLRATEGLQVPWETSSLIAPIRLGRRRAQ